MAWRAVAPEIGTAAASSNESPPRFADQLVRSADRKLGEGAFDLAHHLVAGLEARNGRADRLDRPREIPTPDADLGSAQPERETSEVRLPGHDVPHVGTATGRVHPDEDVFLPDHRILDVSQFQHIGRSVPVLNDRLHVSPS